MHRGFAYGVLKLGYEQAKKIMQPRLTFKMKTTFLLLLSLAAAPLINASEQESCADGAATQSDLSSCASSDYQQADAELNRVYQAVRDAYSDDGLFLEKLKQSQRAWITLRDADLALEYPHMDEPDYYGSVMPMCIADYQASLTWQRVDYLKRWLEGTQEGDVCSGSLMTEPELLEQREPKQ